MAELGDKHECLNCGGKFYDLGRAEIVCPKCGANQQETANEKTSTKGKRSKVKAPTDASSDVKESTDLKEEKRSEDDKRQEKTDSSDPSPSGAGPG